MDKPASEKKNPLIHYGLPILFLFLTPFALYWQSVKFDYVLDDKMVITENQYVNQGIDGVKDIFGYDSFKGYFGEQMDLLPGGRYRPLSIATFALEKEFLGKNDSAVGHFNNILLYAFSVLLLFGILSWMIPPKEDNYWWISFPFVASLLFACHPIHIEVVANVKSRDEILALAGALIALFFSWHYLKKGNLLWLLPTGISLFISILAKENGLTWVAIIPLAGYYFLPLSRKRLLILGAFLGSVGLSYLALRYQVLGYLLDPGTPTSESVMNNPFKGMTLGEKLATTVYTLGVYIKLLLLPHPLTHDYYPYQVPIMQWSDWRTILAFLVNFGLGIYALLQLGKKTIVSFGILFYFITLSIVSNVAFTTGTFMNERFVYMSSLGFCLILAYWISRWLPDRATKLKIGGVNLLSVSLFLMLLIGYVAKTVHRLPDWKDTLSLNSSAAKYSPNSARANCFMGVALFEEYKVETDPQRKAELLDQAAPYIDRALAIVSGYDSALTMKSGIAAELYKRNGDLAQLLKAFDQILLEKKQVPYINEYLTYLVNGRRGNINQMINFLYRVGYQYNTEQRGDAGVGVHYLRLAYQLDSGNARINWALGKSYLALGDTTQAQSFLNVAYQIDPSLPR